MHCKRKGYCNRHREEVRERVRSYRLEHRATLNEYTRIWRLHNQEHQREYRKRNRERIQQHETLRQRTPRSEQAQKRSRVHYLKNRKAINERHRLWRKENPGQVCAHASRYRARKLNANGSHTSEEFELICQRQRGRCFHCAKTCKLTRDHIVPLSRGGTDFAYNLQGLCKPCNSAKHAKLLKYAHPSLFDRAS